MTEYFRDTEGKDVLFFIDNIFRFTQAGSEVSALLGRMTDAAARAVIGEILRVLAPASHLLVVEETNPRLEAGDAARADLGYTRGRPVAWYVDALKPLALVATSSRRIEPGYPRQDVGTYMFFRRT